MQIKFKETTVIVKHVERNICNYHFVNALQSSTEDETADGASSVQRAALNVLHVAASYGNTWLVRYLLEEAGVPVNRHVYFIFRIFKQIMLTLLICS